MDSYLEFLIQVMETEIEEIQQMGKDIKH